jgi:hypothetical protein
MRRTCAFLFLVLSIVGSADGSRAGPANASVDPVVMSEVLMLLRELGYVPGSATESMDKETERALTLFNKAENPPELSGIQDKYVENLTRFRDALRASLAERKRLAEQATVFLQTPHGDSLTHLVVDRNATRVVSTDATTIKGWDAGTGRQRWSTTVPAVVLSNFNSIAISDDAKYAFSFGSAIRVYDADSGAVVRTFWTQHAEIAAALAPRPGTNELVVGEYENDKVVIYDWKTGLLVVELGSHANGNWQDGRTRQAPMLLRLRPRIRS